MPAMHAGVVSRNIQRDRSSLQNKGGALPPGISRSGSGKPPTARGHVKHVKGKGKKGKKGKKDQYDLIVNIDLDEWQLSDEQVSEFKEVFMLFDKDEDGVLTFPELNIVMKSLGQRPTEKELIAMVKDVSEDQIYHTIEFNEFLQMMSKQQRFGLTEDSLKEAFKIFDKDDDGRLTVPELRHIMQSLGEKMTEEELDEMVVEADKHNEGLINYEEFVRILCGEDKHGKKAKNRRARNAAMMAANAAAAFKSSVAKSKSCKSMLTSKGSTSSKSSSNTLKPSAAANKIQSGNSHSSLSNVVEENLPPETTPTKVITNNLSNHQRASTQDLTNDNKANSKSNSKTVSSSLKNKVAKNNALSGSASMDLNDLKNNNGSANCTDNNYNNNITPTTPTSGKDVKLVIHASRNHHVVHNRSPIGDSSKNQSQNSSPTSSTNGYHNGKEYARNNSNESNENMPQKSSRKSAKLTKQTNVIIERSTSVNMPISSMATARCYSSESPPPPLPTVPPPPLSPAHKPKQQQTRMRTSMGVNAPASRQPMSVADQELIRFNVLQQY